MNPADTLAGDPHGQALFVERLPWYINGTLIQDERSWFEAHLAESGWARDTLEIEGLLVKTCVTVPEPQGDLGLHRLMRKVEADKQALRAVPSAGAASAQVGWWHQLADRFSFLARPGLAYAAWALVVAQAGWIGMAEYSADAEQQQIRSGPGLVHRSLRVTFVKDVGEEKLRHALIGAGARIVAGPNQFGEYWLWSQVNSIDEMRTALQASGVVATMVVDESLP
ncbi:MAG: hypothetical protein RLY71_1706 [Pseudomonadota bacterium]|jgi:hypothetical protein